jgi:hypothetical protein
MALRRLLLLRLRERAEKKREWSGGDRMAPGGAGCRPNRGKPVGQRRVHDAGVRPPRGRRRVERGERPRAGERGGEAGPCCLAGPKRRRVGPAAPVPLFLFFEFLFLILFLNSFGPF